VADRFEAGEVAVEGDDLAAVLCGDGCDHRVRDEVAERVRLVAEAAQEGEVAGSGRDGEVQGLCTGGVDELEGVRPSS
jgi:hypothetical protein